MMSIELTTEVFKIAMDKANDIIFLLSESGKILSANELAIKYYGYSKEELLSMDIFDLRNLEKKDGVLNNQFNIAKDNGIGFQTLHYKKNKTSFPVEVKSIGIDTESGKFVLSIVRDITERKLIEKELNERYEELTSVYEELTATEEELRVNYEELEKSKEEIEKANSAKDKFLANMSHEIRTPINGITGVIELLSFTELSVEQKEYINMIRDSSKVLINIVNNLLDISKIEAGDFQLNNKVFNIKENLDRIIKEFSFICSSKNLDFYYYIDPLIPSDLNGDELRLNQILINIMNNAIKFTEKGHIILKINKESQKGQKIIIKFTVSDTGVGIKEDLKKDLFNKFFQQDYSYNKNYSGTGMGLSITKELVKHMNGEIWFESQEGDGSTFCFKLEFLISPIKEPEVACDKEISEKNSREDKAILIVEDNALNMKIAIGMLKKIGYKFKSASNGKEALEILKEFSPDLILMDIQMPELNGFETTKIIRKQEAQTKKHVPIIAMTAYAMSGDRELCINSGMDDYMSKPFDINKLKEIIENNLM